MPPCLTLSIIRYGPRVKWSNPGKAVAPSLHLGVVAIEKEAFGSPSTNVANFTLLYPSAELQSVYSSADQGKSVEKSDNETAMNKSKDIGKRMEDQTIPE